MSGDVNVRITATDQASGAFRAVSAEAVKFGAVVGTSVVLAQRAFDTLTNITIGRVTNAIKEAGQYFDMSQKLGISVESLASYKLAAEQSGTTVAALGQGIKTLSGQMLKHGEMFRSLGIDTQDADKALRQLADIFSAMPDDLGKSALATKLFGRAGQEMILLLNLGSKGLDESAEKSRQYAAAMKALVPEADRLDDTWTEMSISSQALGANLALTVVPALNEVATAMALAVREGGVLQGLMVGIGGVVTEALGKEFKLGLNLAGGDLMKAMDLFGGVSPFRTNAEHAQHFKTEVVRLKAELAEMEASPFTLRINIDAARQELEKMILRVQYFDSLTADERLKETNLRLKTDYRDARDLRPGADALAKSYLEQQARQADAEAKFRRMLSEYAGGRKSGSRSSGAEDRSFDTLLKQISEKSALLALDAQETTKLTDAQRMALKVMTALQGGYLKLTDAQKELLAGKLEEMLANDQLNQSTEARRKAIEEERKAIEEYLKEEERMQALVADFIGGGRTQIERTGQVSETIGMRARDREILEANRRLEDDALAARRRAFSDIKDPQLYQQAIEGINAALVRQKSELSAVTGAAYDYATSWESGVKTAISSYLDEIDDMATSMNNVVTKAFNGMEDALVSFVQTGKLDFRSLADSIIADMLRISIRENITGPLAKWAGSLFENADGGVYSGPGISAYSGQIVSRPTVFPFASGIGLMGEAGPEAILPLKRGANGKLGVEGGGAQTIIVNVTSTTGDRAEIRRSAASGARAALGIMSGARRYG